MNDSIWFIIFIMALATFLTRRLMLSVPEKILTKRVKRALRYMPIGVFCALVLPAILLDNHQWVIKLDYLVASVVCIALYCWKRNFLQSFIVGYKCQSQYV